MACGECGIDQVYLGCPAGVTTCPAGASDVVVGAVDQTMRKIATQIDSGAAMTVMKYTEATDYPLLKPRGLRQLRAANGTPIKDLGDRHVHLLGPDGGCVQIVRVGATDVVNNLLSVSALEHTRHRLVINGNERYYKHKVSKVRTQIHRMKNEYFVDYNVILYIRLIKWETVRGMRASSESHECQWSRRSAR